MKEERNKEGKKKQDAEGVNLGSDGQSTKPQGSVLTTDDGVNDESKSVNSKVSANERIDQLFESSAQQLDDAVKSVNEDPSNNMVGKEISANDSVGSDLSFSSEEVNRLGDELNNAANELGEIESSSSDISVADTVRASNVRASVQPVEAVPPDQRQNASTTGNSSPVDDAKRVKALEALNNATYNTRLGASVDKASNAIKGAFAKAATFSRAKFKDTKMALLASPKFVKVLEVSENTLNRLEKHPKTRRGAEIGGIVFGFLVGGKLGALAAFKVVGAFEVSFLASNAIKNQISPSEYYKAEQAKKETNKTTEQQNERIQNIESSVQRIADSLELGGLTIVPERRIERSQSANFAIGKDKSMVVDPEILNRDPARNRANRHGTPV